MAMLLESRKRDASIFLDDPEPLMSKRLRLASHTQVLANMLEGSVKHLNEIQSGSTSFGLSSQTTIQDNDVPIDGAKWAELFVKEMMSVCDINDAKNRAFKMLEMFEKSITIRSTTEATQKIQEEQKKIKEQLEAILHENSVLKRAVVIQNERQKDFGEKMQELEGLKQMVSQYQEKIRTLEMSNYALGVHLQRAQQNNPIPSHFHPDVF